MIDKNAINIKIEEAISDPQKFIEEKIIESQVLMKSIEEIINEGYLSFSLLSLHKLENDIIQFLEVAKENSKNNLFQYLKLGKKYLQLQLDAINLLENTATEMNVDKDNAVDIRDTYIGALMIIDEVIDTIVKERSEHYGEDNKYEDYDDSITSVEEVGTNPHIEWNNYIAFILDGIKLQAFSPYDN